uniref:SKA complex subunit 1 n=1 Tax=Anopheles farauti TaxID=69004 RepID=A0A182QTM7_9DIPT
MNPTLENIFKKQSDTVKRIELFFDIYKCKEFVSSDLRELKEDACTAAEKLRCIKEYLESDRKDVYSQFIEIMQKLRRNEQLMLHLLEIGPQSDPAKEPAPQTCATKQMPLNESGKENLLKMHLQDYSKSPFAARSKPNKDIRFYEFEASITEEQFETLPKYLKGRMQLSELANFLEDVIKCFEEKYTLMYKQRKAVVNQHDVAIWKEYNNLQPNFPDHNFITQEDLSRKSGKALDKKSYMKLQMLRHLHILQEVRSEGMVYFLWTYNK